MKLQNINLLESRFNEFLGKFTDWAKREEILKEIAEIFNNTDNYKCVVKKQQGFYIIPKNVRYLVRVKVDYSDPKNCKVNFINYKGDVATLDSFALDSKSDGSLEFPFNEIKEITHKIDDLILKVKDSNIISERKFRNLLTRIGVKKADKEERNKTKDLITNNLLNTLSLPSGIKAEATDIQPERKTFTFDIVREDGDNFLLGVGISPDSNNPKNIIASSIRGCKFDDKVENLNKNLQDVLIAISKILDLPNDTFKLKDNVEKDNQSQKEETSTEVKVDSSLNIRSEILNLFEDKINILTEKATNPDEIEKYVFSLLNGIDPEAKDSKGNNKTVKLNDDEINFILRKFFASKSSKYKDELITDQALDMIYEFLKANNFNLKSSLIKFLVKCLDKNIEINSLLLKVLVEKDPDLKLLKKELNNENSFLYDLDFWETTVNSDELYNLAYFLSNNFDTLNKDYILQDNNLEVLKDDFYFDNTYKTNDKVALKDILKIGNKYRDESTIYSILKILDDKTVLKNDDKTTLNNLRGYLQKFKLKDNNKLDWEILDDLLEKTLKLNVKQIHKSKKDEYEKWVKMLPKLFFDLTEDEINNKLD